MDKDTPQFKATKLYNSVWTIDEGGVRCFLVTGSKKAVLIDCCMNGTDQFSELVHSLTKLPIELMLTHADRDHIGGQQYFDAPYMHPSEYDYYCSKGNTTTNVKPLWEGETIDLGETLLEVILIPGHTPGSIAFLDRKRRVLYVGDTVQTGPIHMFGLGRNLDAFIQSLIKLEALKDSFDTIHASHGEVNLGTEWIGKTRAAAEALKAGELEGTEPPFDLPCKVYKHEGITLLY